MVALLLDRGADINDINKVTGGGWTPFLWAVSVRGFSFPSIFEFLLMVIVSYIIG